MILPNIWKNEIHVPNHQPVSWHMIMYDPPVHIGFADPCRPRQSCARQAPSLGFGRPKMCRLDLILCNSVFQCHIWIYLKPRMTLDDFRIFRIARFLTYPHLSWRNNGTWDNGKSRGTVAPAFATRLRFLKEILPVSSSSKSRKAFKISSFGSRFRILWVIIFRNLADQDAYVDWWLIPLTHTDIYMYIYIHQQIRNIRIRLNYTCYLIDLWLLNLMIFLYLLRFNADF